MLDTTNPLIRKDYSFVIATNIWSPHMVPIAKELASIVGVDSFRMVIFENVHDERLKLGWDIGETRPEWSIGPPQNESEYQRLLKICLIAEVAVLGSVPTELLAKRADTGKLTFIMSERILKKKWHSLRMINPRYAWGIKKYKKVVNNRNMHALAIGHYASADFKTIGAFDDRIWKWGYFVELNPNMPTKQEGRPIHLLWVGRILKWKRVDILVKAVAKIQDQIWFGKCTIVGEGPEKRKLLHLKKNLGIGVNKLEFLAPAKIDEVRSLMKEHDVYILTSNQQEGWGAVAGEAMTEGCVLVANEQAGASHSLINHGKTGFLFADGDVEGIVRILSEIGNNATLREQIRRSAWRYMWETWSPKVGAERLIALSQDLLKYDRSERYLSGPCSCTT